MAAVQMSATLANALFEAGVINESGSPLAGLGRSSAGDDRDLYDDDSSDEASSALRRGLRIGLEQDHQRASEAWDKVDAQLERRVRERRQRPVSEDAPLEVAGNGAGRRAPPSPVTSRALMTASASAPAPSFSSSLGGLSRGRGGADEDADRAHRTSASSLQKEALTQACRESRASMLRIKGAESALAMKDHAKRKLRMKITDLLTEVSRRQKLHDDQRRARRFRERKARRGLGPKADLGDHSVEALGLSNLMLTATDDPQDAASPRRVCILDNLTLDELDMLRMNSRFFFAQAFENEDGRSQPEDEELIDFFACARGPDREMSVGEYVHKLRRKLVPAPSLAEKDIWAAALAPGEGEAGALAEDVSQEPPEPLEFMPCMGRRRAVRNDMESPTLRKAREVLVRKELADRKVVEDRREAMAQREALNAFKAGEQQREMQMQTFRQKELHKVRMLAAEERKQQFDADEADRLIKFDREKQEKLARGCLKAAVEVEKRRIVATEHLDQWQAAALEGERRVREQDRLKVEASEASWTAYCNKLWKIGVDRHTHITTQAQRNDALRDGIQMSLVQQLALRQKRESEALFNEIETKQAAAAERRKGLSSRYNFVEKAFGPQAVGFDRKVHAGLDCDRRSPAWSRAFSDPSLGGGSTKHLSVTK